MKVPRGDSWRYIRIPCLECRELFSRRAKNEQICSAACRRRRRATV